MKQINFFVMISFIFISANHCKSSRSTQNDCRQFRTGKFYSFVKETREKYNITRTDSFQIETLPSTGLSFTNKIEWINDCEYSLLTISTTESMGDSIDYYLRTNPTKIKIIKSTPDYCIVKGQVKNPIKNYTFLDTIFISK